VLVQISKSNIVGNAVADNVFAIADAVLAADVRLDEILGDPPAS